MKTGSFFKNIASSPYIICLYRLSLFIFKKIKNLCRLVKCFTIFAT